MATASLNYAKLRFSTAGTKQVTVRVTAKGVPVEKVVDVVIKPDPTPPPAPANIYPPDSTLTAVPKLITGAQMLSLGYLQSLVDTTFGYDMKLTKITDKVVYGVSDMGHGYSKEQHWNADGTYLKLGRRNLLDGNTYKKIRNMSTPSGQTLWSNTVPNKLYVFGANKILTFNPATNSVIETIYDFTSMAFDTTSVLVGNYEGNIDNNDKYVVLNFKKLGVPRNILFDLQTKSIVWNKSDADLGVTGGDTLDWISVSQSGNYIVIARKNSAGTATYKQTLSRATGAVVASNLGGFSHRDCGYDLLGNEVLSGMNYPVQHRLSTGVKTDVIPLAVMDAVYGNNVNQGHSSCRNIDYPGWGCFSFTAKNSTAREIFTAKLDGSQTVRRYGNSFSSVADYSREPQASPDRISRRIIFSSDCGDATGDIHSFILERING